LENNINFLNQCTESENRRRSQGKKKGCTRLAAASDKVYQLLAHGRWFSLGTSASSTTKTGRHDIAEILLKVALNTQKINQYFIAIICSNPIKFAYNGLFEIKKFVCYNHPST
jgi:hypothetical protein